MAMSKVDQLPSMPSLCTYVNQFAISNILVRRTISCSVEGILDRNRMHRLAGPVQRLRATPSSEKGPC